MDLYSLSPEVGLILGSRAQALFIFLLLVALQLPWCGVRVRAHRKLQL